MCSALGPRLTNAFLAHYEQIWLQDCQVELKPVYYKIYVNDIFALIRSPHHLGKCILFIWKKKKKNNLTFRSYSI